MRNRATPQRTTTAFGFTLVELLVVIGIIAVLISILLPSLTKVRRQANRTVCASNLRQMGIVWHMYANEFKGFFPDNNRGFGTWELITDDQKSLLKQKLKVTNGKVFYCPDGYGFTGGAHPDEDWDKDPGSSATEVVWMIGYSIYATQDNAIAWNNSLQNNLAPPFKNNERNLADRPLVMDVVIKYGPPYTPRITWAYSSHFNPRTSRPDGQNTLYGDGSVRWKNFTEMTKRLVNYPNQFERWW